MNHKIALYRKRYIPNEIIHLKDDNIIMQSEDLILTQWNTLKPRADISRGISAYFMNKGYKISKIYNNSNQVVYWYCDIIKVNISDDSSSIVFEDLLADVIVYENGFVKVLDTGEVAEALKKKYINVETAIMALSTLDQLLQIIYSGQFDTLQSYINKAEAELS